MKRIKFAKISLGFSRVSRMFERKHELLSTCSLLLMEPATCVVNTRGNALPVF